MGTLMKKVGSILLLAVILAGTSHAAIDPLKRGLHLYKKNHYEDAIRLLYNYLPAAENHHQAKTHLGLGMICLANARLYRDLYQAALETNLDYFKRLLAVKGPSASQMANPPPNGVGKRWIRAEWTSRSKWSRSRKKLGPRGVSYTRTPSKALEP